MKLLSVVWKDHHSDYGWHNISNIKEDDVMLNTSVGFLIKETEESIVLAQTYIKSIEMCGELLYILKINITNQKELK